MSSGIAPPIQIVAAGKCPQGAAPGDTVSDVVGCDVVNGGTGQWQVTAKDPRVLPNNGHALIVSGGNGSNPTGGVVFGQSQAQTVVGADGVARTLFLYSTYGAVSGVAIDVESQFIIVRWPNVPTNVE